MHPLNEETLVILVQQLQHHDVFPLTGAIPKVPQRLGCHRFAIVQRHPFCCCLCLIRSVIKVLEREKAWHHRCNELHFLDSFIGVHRQNVALVSTNDFVQARGNFGRDERVLHAVHIVRRARDPQVLQRRLHQIELTTHVRLQHLGTRTAIRDNGTDACGIESVNHLGLLCCHLGRQMGCVSMLDLFLDLDDLRRWSARLDRRLRLCLATVGGGARSITTTLPSPNFGLLACGPLWLGRPVGCGNVHRNAPLPGLGPRLLGRRRPQLRDFLAEVNVVGVKLLEPLKGLVETHGRSVRALPRAAHPASVTDSGVAGSLLRTHTRSAAAVVGRAVAALAHSPPAPVP